MKRIILVELHGLQVSKSMKIQYKNTDLYLYSREYFKTIDDMKIIIQKIRESPNSSNHMEINNFIRFDIGNEKFTYLVCE